MRSRSPHGVQVVIKAGFELVVGINGVRFKGRFLFLPSQLRAGDPVWLRIERAESERSGHDLSRAVDVTARVTYLFGDDSSVFAQRTWRPSPGGRFSVTIDRVDAAGVGDERTLNRWSGPSGDDTPEPTEPTVNRQWSATVPDTYDVSGTADAAL